MAAWRTTYGENFSHSTLSTHRTAKLHLWWMLCLSSHMWKYLAAVKFHNQNKIELRLQRTFVLRCVGLVPDTGNWSQFIIGLKPSLPLLTAEAGFIRVQSQARTCRIFVGKSSAWTECSPVSIMVPTLHGLWYMFYWRYRLVLDSFVKWHLTEEICSLMVALTAIGGLLGYLMTLLQLLRLCGVRWRGRITMRGKQIRVNAYMERCGRGLF
jgi:hypothetical protein